MTLWFDANETCASPVSFTLMKDEPSPPSIPREFHSEYEDRPFQNCSRCGESLSVFDNYQINKAYRNGECVFEYAFCAPCRDAMLDEFSEESKKNLMDHQQHYLREMHGIGECAFCGKSQAETPMKDFVITALCRSDRMLDSLMICEACQLGMHELLSEKTRDVRRRFFEELPGVPPDWEVWDHEEKGKTLISASPNQGPPTKVIPQVTHQLQTLVKPEASPSVKKAVKHSGSFLDCGLELIWVRR